MSGRSVNKSAPVTTRGGLIVRKRRYYRYKCLIQAAKRPDHGTKGDLLDLFVNWYRIKFDRRRIFVYKISMHEVQQQLGRGGGGGGGACARSPANITHSDSKSKIFWKTLRDYIELFPNIHRVVFDDCEYAFTPDRINMNEDQGLSLVCAHPEKEGKKVAVNVNYLLFFDLDLSSNIDSSSNKKWTCRYLNNLLSQNSRYAPSERADQREIQVSKRFTHIYGGMFFVPHLPKAMSMFRVDVQPGVEAWLGLYASVRRMENFDPVINFGLVNKLFVKRNLNLIDFYRLIECESLTDIPRHQARNFNFKLKGIRLYCKIVPGRDIDDIVTGRVEMDYRFVELKKDTSADRVYMRVEDTTVREQFLKEFKGRDGRWKEVWRNWRNVRMDEWYKEQGHALKYRKLPLCLVKTGKREDLIPIEVLCTHDQPQKYIKLLSFYAKMKIAKLLARTPVQVHKCTNNLVRSALEYDKDPFMEAMNISLDPNMIECEGRAVQPCAVLAKSELDESVTKLEMKKESGEFLIERAMETSTKKIRFVVFKLTDAITAANLREFYGELVKKCVARGFNVPESDLARPPIFKEATIVRRSTMIAQMIEDVLEMFSRYRKTDDEILVFLFFTKLVDDVYGEIKYLCDIRYGVVSQVVDEETVRKACTKAEGEILSDHKSIYHQISLKLNAKLGGVNQILGEPDEPEYGRMPGNEKTMFIGIHLVRPSPNYPIKNLSLAAIVASMDKNAAKYAVRIKVNSPCGKSVQHFNEHFSILLAKYHSINGFLPERVVILRGGVSDSEIVKAATEDLKSIKYAWNMCANGKKCPPFTYIIVQKNHKTRFFQRPKEENGEVTNPPMGTIVDKDVVTPHLFDFYMVSHYTQLGTTRPIHYTVVYDDYNSSADEIQELVFRLCFLNARCSKPISLPSPVYYAHLACERAAFQHQYAVRTGEVNPIRDKGCKETKKEYADRVEKQAVFIEKKLQVSDMHPGMYFI